MTSGLDVARLLWDLISEAHGPRAKAAKTLAGNDDLVGAAFQGRIVRAVQDASFPRAEYLRELLKRQGARERDRLARIEDATRSRDFTKMAKLGLEAADLLFTPLLLALRPFLHEIRPELLETLQNGPRDLRWTVLTELAALGQAPHEEFALAFDLLCAWTRAGSYASRQPAEVAALAGADPRAVAFLKLRAESAREEADWCVLFLVASEMPAASEPLLDDVVRWSARADLSDEAISCACIALGGAAASVRESDESRDRAVARLLELVGHPQWFIRANAALALGEHARRAEEAVPALIALLGDREGEDFNPHNYAADALGRFGSRAAAAVPRLVEHLADEVAHGETSSVGALGRIGPAARDALPELGRLRQGLPAHRRESPIAAALNEAIRAIEG